MKGTPKWMAPEILMTKSYTCQADIWSLGIMCYELATGTNPFHGMSLESIIYNMKGAQSPVIKNKKGQWSA